MRPKQHGKCGRTKIQSPLTGPVLHLVPANAHHDEYGFQPIVVFDGEGRFAAAVLRPAKRPKGVEIRGHLRRLVRAIRSHWPRVEILVRADRHSGVPEVIDLCRAMDVRFILGAPTSARMRRHTAGLEAQVAARYAARPRTDKMRRFTDVYDGAGSWSRTERIIARVETGHQGTDTRFIVTDLAGRSEVLHEKVYCRRGVAENHIKPEDPPRRRPHLVHQGRRQPVSVCSCTPGPTGCCGGCAPPCRSAPTGASPSSTPCGFA